CSSLKTIDLSGFNMSNVTIMFDMFMYCSNLTVLNLSNWDVSKVTNYSGVFRGCKINGVLVNRANITAWNWNLGTLTEDQIAKMF
ncbi:BspA family leucine-rich repeat surface protein, partial [Hespellia stercorisuis]